MGKELKDTLREILNRHDPIAIYVNKKTNFDEYDPEITRILRVYKRYKDLDGFTDQVYKIFQKMFTIEIAGNRERYVLLSKDLWNLLKK